MSNDTIIGGLVLLGSGLYMYFVFGVLAASTFTDPELRVRVGVVFKWSGGVIATVGVLIMLVGMYLSYTGV